MVFVSWVRYLFYRISPFKAAGRFTSPEILSRKNENGKMRSPPIENPGYPEESELCDT